MKVHWSVKCFWVIMGLGIGICLVGYICLGGYILYLLLVNVILK